MEYSAEKLRKTATEIIRDQLQLLSERSLSVNTTPSELCELTDVMMKLYEIIMTNIKNVPTTQGVVMSKENGRYIYKLVEADH